MGLYSRLIFPRLLDLTMASPEMADYRAELLAEVSGDVLEIGFGTGLNLPHYPASVQQLTTVDPNEGMDAIAQKRIDSSSITVKSLALSGESLPFENASFDSVVCTWTLCSIPNATQALSEAYRVLKPGGRFFFIEHGLSPDKGIQRFQNTFTPVQRVIADGCHLNRKIDAMVDEIFDRVTVKTFYANQIPKPLGYFYQGVAEKD